MKYFFAFCLFSFSILSCKDEATFRSVCLPNSLQNGVIAFYPFENGSLDDASSFANHLTNSTSAKAVADRAGNPSCAFGFDNRQNNVEHLRTTNSTFLNNLTSFSVSIWYQPIDTARDGAIYEGLVSRGDTLRCPNKLGEWSVGLFDCRKAVFGHDRSVWANSVVGMVNCPDEVTALTGVWHHVVAIKDNDTYSIYFNGQLQNTETGTANCPNAQLTANQGDFS